MARDKTAFVFAGGGTLGAVQVGMLGALTGAGVVPDFVVGASVGAVNAAFFAGSPDAMGAARLARIWKGLRRSDVFRPGGLGTLLDVALGRDHLLSPGPLADLLVRHLPYRLLEEAAIPCHIVTTDLLDGLVCQISEGPVVPALLASVAIPGVFPPVRHGHRFLFDGGVASNTPVANAVALGASRVIVLPAGSPCQLDAPPRGAVGMALHALNLLIARQLVHDLELLAGCAEFVVVPPLCPLDFAPHEFGRIGDIVDRAEGAAVAWLAEGGLKREGIPEQLRPHSHALAEIEAADGRRSG